MPSITSKKQGIAALSWDAFPEPPPEATNWKPDPNSIAKPGVLKDPRFNKDPQAEQKRAAMKRETKFRGYKSNFYNDSRSTSSSAALIARTPHPDISKRSAQKTRSPYPIALEPAQLSSTSVVAAAAVADIETRGQALKAYAAPFVSTRAAEINPTEVDPTVKETVENFPTTPVEYSRGKPTATLNDRHRSTSPNKSGILAWAGPLEKLLAEGIGNEYFSSVKHSSVSTPPYKHNAFNGVNGTTGSMPSSHVDDKVTSATKDAQEVDLEAQFMAANEFSRRVPGTTAIDTLVNGDEILEEKTLAQTLATENFVCAKEGIKLQEGRLLEDSDMKLSAQYKRSLDIVLIKFMEGELDLGEHGTKVQLSVMDDQVFRLYFEKVQIAHRQLWVAEKLKEMPPAAHDKLSNGPEAH